MTKVIPIAAIQARTADPTLFTDAEERIRRVNARMMPHKARMKARASQAIRANNPAAKVQALREMVDITSNAVSGIAACGKGCGTCCHVAVMMCADEAEIIGQELGVKPAKPSHFIKHADEDSAANKHYGEPCPFLVNQQCSIYDSRPLACRTLFNMDRDALLCTVVPGDPPKVPYLNHWPMTKVIARAFFDSANRFADLRDFFPNGSQSKGKK